MRENSSRNQDGLKYQKLYNWGRTLIMSGVLRNMDKFPSEHMLQNKFGYSRQTVRNALDRLEQDGLIARVKGSGTYVTEPKIQHESTRFVIGYQEESRERHNHLHTSVLALQKEKPGKLAAKALGLAEGERVTRMVRLRWLEGMYNGCPIVYTTVYVPVRLFPEMEEQNFTDASFYEMLDRKSVV